MAKSKSTHIARIGVAPNRKALDARLNDLRQRIWRARGIMGSARSYVREELRAPCSDAVNALDVAYGMLEDVCTDLEPATLLAPFEVKEVRS